MATTYPKDQFDDLPDDVHRVGAHRGPKKRGSGWITFAWAALATGVLVVAGVFGVSALGSSADADLDNTALGTSTPEPTVDPVTDPTTIAASRNISLTILNGTTNSGLDTVAEKALEKAKWPVDSAADAQSTNHETTVVYYGKAADEDVARGVSEFLTVGTVQLQKDLLGAPIKVLLGADYQALQEDK